MTSYGVEVGTLAWARRPLRDTDRQLLGDLARQLGTVVHAAGLLDAVRASQERLVLGREEERRRLRRDLHDGLGPALAGLLLHVDTLRNVLRSRLGPEASATADEGLLALRSGIQGTVADVRRIVEGLRPPALDELGLAEAVAQLADRLTGGRRPERRGLRRRAAEAGGGRRGRRVPDQPGGADQRPPARRTPARGPVRLECAEAGSARRGQRRRPRRGRPRADGVGLVEHA